MKKNKEKDNTLIKRKNLIMLLKTGGINRISPSALDLLEKQISIQIEQLSQTLKEKITIKGRKTVQAEDIKETLQHKNNNYPEI